MTICRAAASLSAVLFTTLLLAAGGCGDDGDDTAQPDAEDVTSPDAGDAASDADQDDVPSDTEIPDGDAADVEPPDADAVADAADVEVVDGDCEATTSSDLPGVRIEFTGDRCSWGQDEVQAGIEIPYRVVIESEVEGVVPQPQDGGQCGQPGESGLILFEVLAGDGQRYCLCDEGLCPGPSDEAVTLDPGSWAGTFEWHGRNWDGPSDTGNPRGAPFPPGSYTLEVSAVGVHRTGDGEVPFEVRATLPVELTPATVLPDPALIGAGWFFGECAGPCKGDVTIAGDEAHLRVRTWSEEVVLSNLGTLTQDGRDEAEAIALQLFDAELQETYGCPDCDDGGGSFIELRRKGVASTHTYEYGSPPAALARADAFAMDVIEALRSCTAHDFVEPDAGCEPQTR